MPKVTLSTGLMLCSVVLAALEPPSAKTNTRPIVMLTVYPPKR